METEENFKITKVIQDKNAETRKLYKKTDLESVVQIKLDTAFGINSNPIFNQLQMVGEKYVVFMVGSIVVVKDLSDKS